MTTRGPDTGAAAPAIEIGVADPAFEAIDGAAAPPPGARPYGWAGLVLSLVALVILALLIWLALALAVGAAEIAVVGWREMSSRLVASYQIVRAGDVGDYISIPFRLVIGRLEPDSPAIEHGALVVTMLLQLSLVAAVLAIARYRAGARWRDLLAWHPWRFRSTALLFFILLVAALGLNEAGGLITAYFAPAPNETVAAFGLGFILDFLSNVVIAAVMEELLVRGWLYTALRARLSAWPTILVTAVIFALLHSISSLSDILSTLPLGIAAGYLRERTGSVKAPIALHFLHNTIVYALILA
jgi:membrane protease YdiL (CAAX protease family)